MNDYEIGYCYPTSPNAVKAGWSKTGCFAIFGKDDPLHEKPLAFFRPKGKGIEIK